MQGFKDDKSYRRSLELQLEMGISIPPQTKYQAKLDVVGQIRSCLNFRPGIAMYIYKRFGKKGGVVLDPCTGYGGRLVGWIASQNHGKYIGVDPATITQQHNRKLADSLGVGAKVQLFTECFEDFNIKKQKLTNAVNLVFTSPPYFFKEHYSEEKTQSYMRYPKFKLWLNSFLRPLIQKSYEVLKPGGVFAINIADMQYSNKTYPLELFTVQYAEDCGFKIRETVSVTLVQHYFGIGTVVESIGDEEEGIGSPTKHNEPIFIFQK